jgi:hypothetical protein
MVCALSAFVGRRLAGKNDQDLRGTVVAEIPVGRLTAFELVINLRMAKTANLDLATGIVALP